MFWKEQPHYNATLAACHNLSVSLARELKETGITSIAGAVAYLCSTLADYISGAILRVDGEQCVLFNQDFLVRLILHIKSWTNSNNH